MNQKGFSLTEILIVLLITGILSAIGIPLYQSHIQKAQKQSAELRLAQAKISLEHYYQIHHDYSGASLRSLGIEDTIGQYQLVLQTQAQNYTIKIKAN